MEAGIDGNEILHSVMASGLLGDFTWEKSPLGKGSFEKILKICGKWLHFLAGYGKLI